MKRKYLIQGDLDGACFLYSIANSVVALSGRKPTVNQWSKALQYIPFSADFIDGNVGTVNYDDNISLYEFAIKQAISEYSPSSDYEIKTYPEITSVIDVDNLVSDNSVVVLNISGDHWVCVVSVDLENNRLLTACSDITDVIYDYVEKPCDFNRLYNREYNLNEEDRIHEPSVIQIILKE
ncbi:hypothetical protein OLEAN_C07820 [Oleispira antarctica RB-8]|uniref:Peptidase C39-like domain-containing protein n=1 Tax=Oleispira antarctica RB-8 TaxID=698738 RepID=R4YP70_OLEAN|nr:hypothetical protein OLEAN_C07820 [Oleispira antarctica RB-8]